jgi:hypothetical protein
MADLAAAINNLADAISAVSLGSGSGGSSRRSAQGNGGRWHKFEETWWWGEWGSNGDWWWWNPAQGWISHTTWSSAAEGTLPASGSQDAEMPQKRQRRD